LASALLVRGAYHDFHVEEYGMLLAEVVLGWRMTALQANPFVLGIPLFISATEDAGRFFITPGRRPPWKAVPG
jgi:hypothetical protein